jgi:hypothetical protein
MRSHSALQRANRRMPFVDERDDLREAMRKNGESFPLLSEW